MSPSVCHHRLAGSLCICSAVCIRQQEEMTRREPLLLISLGLFILKKGWSVAVCAHLFAFFTASQKTKGPRSRRPWLQLLGCTGAPGVMRPFLKGIRLGKLCRLPVFNNNHLKLLQLARSYKEMESMRGRGGGGVRARKGYKLRFGEPFECQLLFHVENSRGPLCSLIISHES